MSDESLAARLAELELRYMELQRDMDTLSEVVRALDLRLDRTEASLERLQAGDELEEL